MINFINALNALKAPTRAVEGRAAVYNAAGSIAYTFKHNDKLKEIKVERLGDNTKFFGYGVSHKANIKVLDKDRELALTTSNRINPYFVFSGTSIYTYPYMDITEVHRDENTNELSITCYDRLYKATAHKIEELTIVAPYTIKDYVSACGSFLGLSGVAFVNVPEEAFSLNYEEGANFNGTETIKEVLNMAAEITQTIYYIDKDNKLTFKRLAKDEEAILTITKEDYISLDSKTNRKLTKIISATELGDNISAELAESGSAQYIRNNGFLDLREDRADLVNNALATLGGFTINQFECSWRGNYLLEVGDKIGLITKDNNKVYSYVLDDVITYNGYLSEETRWSYEESEGESADNPTSIGEVISQTVAKVDKTKKEISLLVVDVEDKVGSISELIVDTEGIKASVSTLEANNKEALDGINSDIELINKKVEASMTSEAVELKIQQELENGADKVVTSTGFRFDEEGLTVEKTGKEIKTQITEDGMAIFKNEDAVLVANNEGVKAEDLHATTYLIIGNNSRFEDYSGNRTGCFWIGG